MAPAAHIVLFGYGNESRGDDALGPLLLARAEAWLAGQPQLHVRTVADFQLQIEHALDLRGADLALFVDADESCAAPCVLRRAQARQDATYSTHALSPEAVLYVCRDITGGAPPPSWVLAVRGERFELGEPLTAQATANLEAAWTLLQALLIDGRAEAWDALALVP
ncbi:MAG: hydrogenase maturation protease [Gemmatimonadaceae bacterium]